MKLRVVKKHNAGRGCFVCGVNNASGLHTEFYELEDGTMAARVTVSERHQSYPGRVHGGVCAALLDETIGRALNIPEPEAWAVTAELSVRFKKPVPYDVPLVVVGRTLTNNRRIFTGEGAILLPDGEAAATAKGTYVKQKLSDIADFESSGDSWELYPSDSDPEFFDLPDNW